MTQFVTNIEWNKIIVAIFVVITIVYFFRYSVDMTKWEDKKSIAFFDLGMMFAMGTTAFRFANPRAMHVVSSVGTQVTVNILLAIGIVLIAIGILGATAHLMRRHRSQRKAA